MTRTFSRFVSASAIAHRRWSSRRPHQQDIFAPDVLITEAQSLAGQGTLTLPNAPMTVSLPEAGTLGLAGPQRECYSTARAAVIQLASHPRSR